MIVASLFGHRHVDQPALQAWFAGAGAWTRSHWPILAVLVPVCGAIVAGIVNHYLAVARENRSRALDRTSLRSRVYSDLAARLLAHCARLQHAVAGGSLDEPSWRADNSALYARAQQADAVEALGREYVGFMATIESERRGIGREDPRRAIERYLPFIAAFGEDGQARRLQRWLSS